ncbi:MAG TPA: helix-turn-helix transcriptional regulator [Alphaproteobacteria bacterium]|nr:helix-turn-helix transcriptional regulator [Alphaproteobacteria bacterium]
MDQNNHIKNIRKTKGLTQADLADLAGTTQETIQRLENGKRRLTYDWIKRLSDALGVHPIEITEGPVPDIPKSKEEKEILDTFRELSETEQKLFSSMMKGIISKDDKSQ